MDDIIQQRVIVNNTVPVGEIYFINRKYITIVPPKKDVADDVYRAWVVLNSWRPNQNAMLTNIEE